MSDLKDLAIDLRDTILDSMKKENDQLKQQNENMKELLIESRDILKNMYGSGYSTVEEIEGLLEELEG